MKKSNSYQRAPWVGCVLTVASLAISCGTQHSPAGDVLEVDELSDALSQDQFDCEKAKRECLIAADCEADARKACEETFRACEEPLREERKKVHDACHATRETCNEAAGEDEAKRHACHVAEHKCTLSIDPPEAVCHIDAIECAFAAQSKEAKEACRETERECRDAKRLDKEDLPKPPKCEPMKPPPACEPKAPAAGGPAPAVPPPPAEPPADRPARGPGGTDAQYACERTKRECLIAANCDKDKKEACEEAFRACQEPIRAEHKKVHDACKATRETCDAAATDEAGRHACHIAEHRCNLPVEPADAVCRIEAEECLWTARGTDAAEEPEPPTKPEPPAADPEATPPAKPDPGMKPEPGTKPEPKAPKGMSEAEGACRDAEKTCREAKRPVRDPLPKAPHCAPPPPVCMPAAGAAAPGTP